MIWDMENGKEGIAPYGVLG